MDHMSRLRNALELIQMTDEALREINREDLKQLIASSYPRNSRCYSSVLCRYVSFLESQYNEK